MSKSFNEVPIMPCQPTKCADMGKGFWHWELLYCMHVALAGTDSLLGYIVCQVHNLIWRVSTSG